METAAEGEVLGWSWLVAPYRWHFDARAVGLVRAIAIDGKCLRAKSQDEQVLCGWVLDLGEFLAKILHKDVMGAGADLNGLLADEFEALV